ncbi:type II secretion system minor pseudopilin GspK [Undibacterium sp.]|uniref:type II secretion system minor pseudopilin GspK n=1 Tax=Undibacterium sp. TaxID=1914977 RepID=UPI002C4164CD|nr:type II secretion system minor pseudopilin GspK [Undibacterium sp.]HTD02350.1 type II secretion system minor pseudopilin GspK [Undibacterium sp.]
MSRPFCRSRYSGVSRLARQRGVAVVTALLLTTLAITIVASLFWQQQVQVRSIENQRLQLQKKWVLRGALDWVRLILREDATHSTVDWLGEPWAVNLEETRLDQYVENGRSDSEASDATLSGHIIDAQSRFNLTNLATNGEVNPREAKAFAKLLGNLKIDTALAQAAASSIAMSQAKVAAVGGSSASGAAGPANPASTPGQTITSSPEAVPAVQFLRFAQLDDLLSVAGFTPAMVQVLREYVTVLPRATPINVNTTTAEALSARVEGLSLTDAAAMIASRDRAHYLNLADFRQRFPDKLNTVADSDISTTTDFFIVNGKVKLSRSLLDSNALIERSGVTTRILWIKEN